mmetsp:Transcript_28169/g.67314  ORF Transcript_28169/g.67314 Transcript_28169/m.67314 type:complete len:218 (-) Transcript_28169:851-1504(-)
MPLSSVRSGSPLPQHATLWSSRTAHVWSCRDDILTTRRPDPKSRAARASPISPGSSPLLQHAPAPLVQQSVSDRKPSCCFSLLPQHFTAPLSRITHAWLEPVAIAMAVRPVPTATAGRTSPISSTPRPLSALSPIPNCPSALSPKHLRTKALEIAHVKQRPHDTVSINTGATPPKSTTSRSAGTLLPLLSSTPSPICPSLLEPQHLRVLMSEIAHVW